MQEDIIRTPQEMQSAHKCSGVWTDTHTHTHPATCLGGTKGKHKDSNSLSGFQYHLHLDQKQNSKCLMCQFVLSKHKHMSVTHDESQRRAVFTQLESRFLPVLFPRYCFFKFLPCCSFCLHSYKCQHHGFGPNSRNRAQTCLQQHSCTGQT